MTESSRWRTVLVALQSRVTRGVIRATTSLSALGHLVAFGLIYWLAFGLRFDFQIPDTSFSVLCLSMPWVLATKFGVFYAFGHYHGRLSCVTFADLVALLRSAAVSLVAVVAVDHFFFPFQIHHSVLLLDYVTTIVVFGGLRTGLRLWQEQCCAIWRSDTRDRVLLVGADRTSGVLANQINSLSRLDYRICGFLAVNGQAVGARLGQIPVLGNLREVKLIAAAHGVERILITAGTLPGKQLRELKAICDESELTLKIIPPVEELFRGRNRIPLRDIEIGDLLHRESIELDGKVIGDLLAGRRVLVTGAGGSIGSEICRQVLRFQPKELILLGRGENRIFEIVSELQMAKTAARLVPVIGSITDKERMAQVFSQHRPEIVFHTAAHKHVPLMEANVGEAIRNNVLGTKCIADLAAEHEAEAFVLVSTDKAVRPTSVMGVTKYLAERYVLALSERSMPRFVVVRFGNVLGSAGSVVPLFLEQIRRGGPITVTDPRMTRYFMTIPEAAQLVLQASAIGRSQDIFVLDMGEAMKITDLARDLICLSGLPENSMEIVYTGVRPGEKIFEELYGGDEQILPTPHPKVRMALRKTDSTLDLPHVVSQLETMNHSSNETLRNLLCELVPEYRPTYPASPEPNTRVPTSLDARA